MIFQGHILNLSFFFFFELVFIRPLRTSDISSFIFLFGFFFSFFHITLAPIVESLSASQYLLTKQVFVELLTMVTILDIRMTGANKNDISLPSRSLLSSISQQTNKISKKKKGRTLYWPIKSRGETESWESG